MTVWKCRTSLLNRAKCSKLIPDNIVHKSHFKNLLKTHLNWTKELLRKASKSMNHGLPSLSNLGFSKFSSFWPKALFFYKRFEQEFRHSLPIYAISIIPSWNRISTCPKTFYGKISTLVILVHLDTGHSWTDRIYHIWYMPQNIDYIGWNQKITRTWLSILDFKTGFLQYISVGFGDPHRLLALCTFVLLRPFLNSNI